MAILELFPLDFIWCLIVGWYLIDNVRISHLLIGTLLDAQHMAT